MPTEQNWLYSKRSFDSQPSDNATITLFCRGKVRYSIYYFRLPVEFKQLFIKSFFSIPKHGMPNSAFSLTYQHKKVETKLADQQQRTKDVRNSSDDDSTFPQGCSQNSLSPLVHWQNKKALTMVWERFWTNSCSVELFRTLKTVYFTFSSSYISLPWWPQNWSSVTICPGKRDRRGGGVLIIMYNMQANV